MATAEETTNTEIIQKMFGIWGEAMQTQDVTKFDAFVEHLTDDYVCTNPMMVAAGVNMWECVGKDAMIPMMTKTFFEDKVSPIEFKPMVGLTACGPVIVYKNICDGLNKGETVWNAGPGAVSNTHVLVFREGKMASWTIYEDPALVPAQAALMKGEEIPAAAAAAETAVEVAA